MLMATVATNWVVFLFLALTVHLSHTHKDLSSHRISVIHINPTLMTNLKDMYTKWNHHETLKYTKKILSRHESVNLIPPSCCSTFPSCHSSRTAFKVKHTVNTVKLWEAADRQCVLSRYQSNTREQADCILSVTLPFFRLRAQLDDCTLTLLQLTGHTLLSHTVLCVSSLNMVHNGSSYCMLFMSCMVTCAFSVLDPLLTHSNLPTTTTSSTTTKDGNHQSDKLKTAKQLYYIYNVTNWLSYCSNLFHTWHEHDLIY